MMLLIYILVSTESPAKEDYSLKIQREYLEFSTIEKS